MKLIFSKRTPLAFAAFMAAAAIAACDSDSTTGPSTAAAIAASTTPPATATSGLAIAGPSVLVTDAAGAPAAGVEVTFAVTAGGGAIQNPVVITGSDGLASAGAWQIGSPGANTVTATAAGLAPLSFTTTASLGAGTQIVKRSGDNQIGSLNTDLPIPLTVKLVSAGGIGIPGQTVTFTVTAGGGSIAGSPTVTDASGFATSGAWTLGPNFGINTVEAQAGTLTATFTAVVDPCEDRTPLAVDQTVTGTLDFAADKCAVAGFAEDRHSLTTANGAAVNITLASTAFDAFLKIDNAAATVTLLTNDDASSSTTNSALIRLITAASTKTVTATSKTAGATGDYTLSVVSASANVVDCSTPLIEIGASTTQDLATTDCTTNWDPASGDWSKTDVAGDAFLVYIPAGTTVRISQTAVPLDALIGLYSPAGALITYRDGGGVGATQTEVITYTATASGFHKIVAGSYCLLFEDPYRAACDYGAYTLSVVTP